MKRVLFLSLGTVLGVAGFFLLGYLAMGLHDLLHPSPEISESSTFLFVVFFALLFASALFMAVRLFRYAFRVDPKER